MYVTFPLMRHSHVYDTPTWVTHWLLLAPHTHIQTFMHVYKHTQIRDAAALCEYFDWLEKEVRGI